MSSSARAEHQENRRRNPALNSQSPEFCAGDADPSAARVGEQRSNRLPEEICRGCGATAFDHFVVDKTIRPVVRQPSDFWIG
jgi:hypothetical protein